MLYLELEKDSMTHDTRWIRTRNLAISIADLCNWTDVYHLEDYGG